MSLDAAVSAGGREAAPGLLRLRGSNCDGTSPGRTGDPRGRPPVPTAGPPLSRRKSFNS